MSVFIVAGLTSTAGRRGEVRTCNAKPGKRAVPSQGLYRSGSADDHIWIWLYTHGTLESSSSQE
jgi:hypothetical protein